MPKTKKKVIQTHHIYYEPEEIVTKIYKHEHWLITNLNRTTRNISVGFIHCLLKWIETAVNKAVDLDVDPEESRVIYRNALFDVIKYGKEDIMVMKNIKIIDSWVNANTDEYTFKIEHDKVLYLVIFMQDKLGNDKFSIESTLGYIDSIFPNVDASIKVEKIFNLVR